MPDFDTSGAGAAKKTVGYIVNDWQLSGVLTANSGTRYDLSYSYQSNGASRNITGSPDYGARIVYIGRSGWRLLGQPVRAVQHRGRHWADATTASAWSRAATSCRTAPTRRSTSPWRAPSAWAAAASSSSASTRSTRSTSRSSTTGSTTINYNNPINMTVQNAQYNADGSLESDAPDAAERGLRRGHGRAEHAELPGDDSLPVLARISMRYDRGSRLTGRGSRG